MFVRWKKRKRSYYDHTEHRRRDDQHLSAVLVECVRIDGKPRQQIVAYIGSIRRRVIEQGLELDYELFWERVAAKLDRLDLSRAERRVIEAKLEEIVPNPVEAANRQHEADLRKLRQLVASRR
jgi:hypothetical protein